MTRIVILLCLLLAGCYESVSQRTDREKAEQRVKDLERAQMHNTD